MQQQTSIYIPMPCHEDWNKMTPTQQGKFCSACSKQVIDFSLMSDNQILNVISNQSGKLCGRFDAEQLQRPLIETKIKKQKSWWMALTMPLLFLFDKSEAQQISNKSDTITEIQERGDLIVGKFVYNPIKQITIKGQVVDENNTPLAYASVIHKGFIEGTTTDSLGNFSINIKSNDDSVTLIASYVGFASIEKVINVSDNNVDDLVIKLKSQMLGLSEVVVATSVDKIYLRTAGGISICHRLTITDKIDTSFKKLIGIANIFPNPAPKGSSINIKIKNTGSYRMQLLDNQSRLMHTEEIIIDTKNATTQIQLQSTIAAGMYYLRLINEQTKKQYTEKLIVQ